MNEILKSVVAQFDAKELVKQRDQVSLLIRKPRDPARKKFQQNQVSRNFFGRDFGIPFSIKVPSKRDYDFPKILVGF